MRFLRPARPSRIVGKGRVVHRDAIVDGRIRAIYVVRHPDKLRGFLERTH